MHIGEAEVVMEEVDNVAQVVERVATVAQKVSADVADKLPTHTKLKEIALLIERVDALKEDLEDLEKLVKPAVHKIESYEFQGNYSPAQIKEQN
ncbi:hypothetical protein ACLB2K_016521 [Fragaria x ananassa]